MVFIQNLREVVRQNAAISVKNFVFKFIIIRTCIELRNIHSEVCYSSRSPSLSFPISVQRVVWSLQVRQTIAELAGVTYPSQQLSSLHCKVGTAYGHEVYRAGVQVARIKSQQSFPP